MANDRSKWGPLEHLRNHPGMDALWERCKGEGCVSRPNGCHANGRHSVTPGSNIHLYDGETTIYIHSLKGKRHNSITYRVSGGTHSPLEKTVREVILASGVPFVDPYPPQ